MRVREEEWAEWDAEAEELAPVKPKKVGACVSCWLCAVLCCAGLGWAGLGWAGLGWAGLSYAVLCCAVHMNMQCDCSSLSTTPN